MPEGLRGRRTSGYESGRPDVLAHVPDSAGTVLDIGCSTGLLGAALVARQGARVTGVEPVSEYAAEARQRLAAVHAMTAEQYVATGSTDMFDCLIAADVLEHLVDPWTTLRDACRQVRPGGTVVVSVPNILFWKNLVRVIRERRWPRDPELMFDATHLRWFSPDDAVQLVAGAGLEVVAVEPRYWADGWRLAVYRRLARTGLGPFLGVQTIVRGRKVA